MEAKTVRLGRMFNDAYRLWQRDTYGAMAEKGYPDVRPAHSPVFRHIAAEGSRMVDLANAAGMAKQSMAYLISDLEKAGYVSMSPDPTDGRARLVNLTELGLAAERTLAESSQQLEERIAAIMGPEKMEELRRLMQELLASDPQA